jgi:hypothetical protein
MCRNAPTITPNLSVPTSIHEIRGGFNCSANYSQQDNCMIKYWVAKLWAYRHGTAITNAYLIDTSPKYYSQKIEYSFRRSMIGVVPWDRNPVYGKEPTDIDYFVTFDVVTQANKMYSSSWGAAAVEIQSLDEDFEKPVISYNFKANKSINRVDIRINSSPLLLQDVDYHIFRTDLDTNETEMITPTNDYKVRKNARYEYKILYYERATGRPFVRCDENGNNILADIVQINTDNFDGYTISALTFREINNSYYVGDTWHFICDIDDTTVTQNFDKYLHVGYSKYSEMTSTLTNYMKGTVSAMLGYLECETETFVDNFALVKAWREFISSPNPFLLKSPKGDIWIVNITDSNTSYEENTPDINTRFSFSWAECDNVATSRIVSEGD